MAKEKTNFSRIKKVERSPLLKIEQGDTVYVKILTDFRTGTVKKKIAAFLEVVDLTTGENATILANTMLVNMLQEQYPDGAHVGKCFEITKGEKETSATSGNQYNTIEIYEIEAPAGV